MVIAASEISTMLSARDEDALNRWISWEKSADVILFGEVFGTKSGESPQMLKSFSFAENILTLRFDAIEALQIYNPSSCAINIEGDLWIAAADKAILGWHFYGKEKTKENMCTYTYDRTNENEVRLSVAGSIRSHMLRFGNPDNIFRPLRGVPAVWLSSLKHDRWTGHL